MGGPAHIHVGIKAGFLGRPFGRFELFGQAPDDLV